MTPRPYQWDVFRLGNAVDLIVVSPLLWGAFWLGVFGAGPRDPSKEYARRNRSQEDACEVLPEVRGRQPRS
jgi:hypothetical protein